LDPGAEDGGTPDLLVDDDILAAKDVVGEGREEDDRAVFAPARTDARIFRLDQGPEGPGRKDRPLDLDPGRSRGTRQRDLRFPFPKAEPAEPRRPTAREEVHPPFLEDRIIAAEFREDKSPVKLPVDFDPALDELERGQVGFPAERGARQVPSESGEGPGGGHHQLEAPFGGVIALELYRGGRRQGPDEDDLVMDPVLVQVVSLGEDEPVFSPGLFEDGIVVGVEIRGEGPDLIRVEDDGMVLECERARVPDLDHELLLEAEALRVLGLAPGLGEQ
jgi:hypothetical protein